MAVTRVSQTTAAMTATTSPSVTFASWTPAENDLVVIFPTSTTTATAQAVTNWNNIVDDAGFGTDIEPADTSHTATVYRHWVTSGEASAVTMTYTATNLWTVNETGMVIGVVLRGVDVATPIDLVSFGQSENALTTHVFPALEGDDLSNGSYVLRFVTSDDVASQTYSSPPASHTQVATADDNNKRSLLMEMDATTTTGVDIATANITASLAQEYISFSIAFTAAAGGDTESQEPGDNVGITDASELAFERVQEPVDPIGITDTSELSTGRILTFTDNIGITDDADVTAPRSATATDNIGITDVIDVLLDRAVAGDADFIGITDSVAVTVADAEATSPVDNVGITDTVTRARTIVRAFIDAIGIDDAAVVGDTVARVNMCLVVGAPVFLSRVAFVMLQAHSAAVDMVSRQAGEPEFEGRDATLAFQDREADVVLDCEEV